MSRRHPCAARDLRGADLITRSRTRIFGVGLDQEYNEMLKLRAGSRVVRFSILTSIALASLALGACGAPQSGDPTAAAQSTGSTGTAPTISGTPSSSVVAGQAYTFMPST